MTGRRRRGGFSLVELLVAATVGAIALAIVVQFFAQQTRSAAFQKAVNEASENARVALSLIAWDLNNAGYRVTVSGGGDGFSGDLLGIAASDGGASDQLTIRYLDQDTSTEQRVSYGLGGAPVALRRVQHTTSTIDWTDSATVASVVGLNVRYFTRTNKYEDLQPSGDCELDQTPILDDDGNVVNCLVDWLEMDSAGRLVQRVLVEILARSETTVASYEDPNGTYTFLDGSTYTTEPGYVYHYGRQSVLTPNLGR